METSRPKKLVLSRETVRNLTRKDMEIVEGGAVLRTNAGNCASNPRNCPSADPPCPI